MSPPQAEPTSTARDITRKSQSNLAFALGVLPRQQRRDMELFYAYCRIIDDLADDEGLSLEQRRQQLASWRKGWIEGFAGTDPLQQQLIEMRDRLKIPNQLLCAIIDGCEMDLHKNRYQTWEELDDYIWKVACSVGLVSVRIFGCTTPESQAYAEALGRALQLTNILRDVGEDLIERDRIYLPLQDLRQFRYREQDLVDQVTDSRFLELMEFQATRAENWFTEARLNHTRADHHALRPARIMAFIYHELLDHMRRDGFRVFERRYRVGKGRKLLILLRHLFD